MEKPIQIVLGEDFYGMSVEEITERVSQLRAEITRLEAELAKKQADLNAAQDFFKPKA